MNVLHCFRSLSFKELNSAGWVSGVCSTWLLKSMYLSWCSLVLSDWHPKPTPQHLTTEYRSRRDSPEESNVHNCISWIHFKWQSCEASHLCMHLITHSQTLNSPVPQVSESSRCLLVRTQSWRPSNTPPKSWWETPGDRQHYHLFLRHCIETVADECIKYTPLIHFGVVCFFFSPVIALYLFLVYPSWWMTLLRKDRGLWEGSRIPSFVWPKSSCSGRLWLKECQQPWGPGERTYYSLQFCV